MSTASNCFRTMCWRDWKWASSPLLPQILEPKTGSSKQKWRQIQLLWPLIRFVFVNYQNQYWFEKLKAPISGSELGWPPCEHLCCCRPCWVVGWIAGETRNLPEKSYTHLFQAAYDTSKGKLVKNNFSLGFATPDFVLHSNVNDGSIFGASLYQKVKNLTNAIHYRWINRRWPHFTL